MHDDLVFENALIEDKIMNDENKIKEIDVGGYVYPFVVEGYNGKDINCGLTLRDYFAAKAMQGLLYPMVNEERHVQIPTYEELAEASFVMADAMIKESNK